LKEVILVTGGAGYIGSHCCKALATAGFSVVVLDNLTTGHRHNVKWGPLEVGNVSHKNFVRRVLRKYKPIAVMHFAGSAYIGESIKKPEKYYKNNTVATLNLLEALREENIDILVFSSTCATYGLPEYLPIDLSHPQRPISPYGVSKYLSEQSIINYSRLYGLRYSILRYFNAAGGDDAGELKEEHRPETHLIPLALASAFEVGPILQVFGCDYPTPDGTCIRDYIHVSSIAAAHVDTLNSILSGEKTSEVRNLGSGRGYSVKEILTAIKRVTGREVQLRYCERRRGDPPALWAARDPGISCSESINDIDRIIMSASLAFR